MKINKNINNEEAISSCMSECLNELDALLIEANSWYYYRFHRGSRYYELELNKNIFGEWEIQRRFGMQHTEKGRIMIRTFDDYDMAIKSLVKLIKFRIQKRHYIPVKCSKLVINK